MFTSSLLRLHWMLCVFFLMCILKYVAWFLTETFRCSQCNVALLCIHVCSTALRIRKASIVLFRSPDSHGLNFQKFTKSNTKAKSYMNTKCVRDWICERRTGAESMSVGIAETWPRGRFDTTTLDGAIWNESRAILLGFPSKLYILYPWGKSIVKCQIEPGHRDPISLINGVDAKYNRLSIQMH